jgi:hypothetical protein
MMGSTCFAFTCCRAAAAKSWQTRGVAVTHFTVPARISWALPYPTMRTAT